MTAHPLQQLSERQKACIRLVADGMTDKEIAIALGIAPETVKTHVTRAMKLLGVRSRHQAARLLLAEDAKQLSPKPVTPPDALAETTPDQPLPRQPAATAGEWREGPPAPFLLREDRSVFVHEELPAWRKPPFPTEGRTRNDLTWLQRIAWTLALVGGLGLAAGSISDAAARASQIFTHLLR